MWIQPNIGLEIFTIARKIADIPDELDLPRNICDELHQWNIAKGPFVMFTRLIAEYTMFCQCEDKITVALPKTIKLDMMNATITFLTMRDVFTGICVILEKLSATFENIVYNQLQYFRRALYRIDEYFASHDSLCKQFAFMRIKR